MLALVLNPRNGTPKCPKHKRLGDPGLSDSMRYVPLVPREDDHELQASFVIVKCGSFASRYG
jgi:hypothetical protein